MRNRLLVGLLVLAGCAAPPEPRFEGGAIVEELDAGGAGVRAGLEAGDRLVEWSRAGSPGGAGPNAGRIGSPADLDLVEATAIATGNLRLNGWRGEERLEVALPPDDWRLAARPVFSGADLDDYLEGRRLIDSGEPELGLERWQAASERLAESGAVAAAAWLLSETGATLDEAGDADAAAAAHRTALELRAGDDRLGAWLWWRRGRQLEPAEADAAYSQALEDFTMPDPLRARLLYLRGVAAYRRSLTDAAEGHCRQARELAPDGALGIRSAIILAKVTRNRGRLEDAVGQLEALAAAARTLDPDSRLHAEALSELGIAVQYRGDLATAEARQRQALEIYQRLGIRDRSLGQARMGLGIIASNRGALTKAAEHFRSAHEIFEETAPSTPFEAWSLNGLGNVAASLGDHDTAEQYFHRVLAIYEATSSLQGVASTWSNLGSVANARGELDVAIGHYEKALAAFESHSPDSRETARIRGNLGGLRAKVGDLDMARELLDHSLAWYQANAPGSLRHAEKLFQRSRVAHLEGELGAAESYFLQTLEIQRRLAPGSLYLASTLHAIGALRRDQGKLLEARDTFHQAIAAFETQKSRLTSRDQDAASFAERFSPLYKDLIDLLVELGEAGEAFGVLERYRAQGLLAMLGARDLLLDQELPPELARRRRSLARIYDDTQARLAGLDDSAEPAEVEKLLAELRSLQQQRAALAAEVLEAAPRLGHATSPQPLDAAAAARALDPGTLLLSYVVLPEASYLFVLGAGGAASLDAASLDAVDLEVLALGVGEEPLRREVEVLRRLVQSPRAIEARGGLARSSQALYRWLVEPVAARVAGAERLLIVPDGPLHALPFAVLADQADDSGDGFLAARKPLHSAVSVTVYDLLKAIRPSRPRPSRVVAFGDPHYARAAGVPTAGANARGALRPLPATRAEVESLAGLFPDARVYLGATATEEQAKAVGGEARILHFACHGAVDHRFPLDSYLALSQPDAEGEAENGLLQAWEIFEQLRLDADLVTLSACETGLGREIGGEGLIGLTRAFQYAGARSVVASLWGVSDQSTGALMARFYGYLKSGMAKDEALRAAQLDLLRGDAGETFDASHPFYWAAFQLIGDWR